MLARVWRNWLERTALMDGWMDGVWKKRNKARKEKKKREKMGGGNWAYKAVSPITKTNKTGNIPIAV